MHNQVKAYRLDEMPLSPVRPGFSRTGIRSEQSVHTINWFEPGYKSIGRHSHPFDQVSYVMAGRLRFFVGDEAFELIAPSVLYVPANVPHGAEPIGDERVLNIDVFSPAREDYLPLCEYQRFTNHPQDQ